MTLSRFRFHGPSPRPVERDPADDHAFAEHVRDPAACITCGDPTYDQRVECELCRYGVTREIHDE